MKNGCILCGGVGSGKSRTAIAYYYKCMGGNIYIPEPKELLLPLQLIIITTARKRDTHDWDDELKPFDILPDDVIVDSWNNIAKYSDRKNCFFIFDEQRVVGSGAWVKSFLKIARSNVWILLSATPGDNWMDYVPVFIANGFYRNRSQFVSRHVVYSRFSKYPKVDRYLEIGRLVMLRNRVLVTMNFNRETEAHHEYVPCKYDTSDYNKVNNRWNIWDKKPIENASEFCHALRRVVNSSKDRGEYLIDICHRKRRVIVFYNFDYELKILRNLNYGESFKIAEWNGHRHEAIPECEDWVYLVQYTAGAEGWNCTTADTIVLYSANYSYKVMQQAYGRIDRLNTTFHDLYYYHFTSLSSIDKAINRCLATKKRFNEGDFFEKK